MTTEAIAARKRIEQIREYVQYLNGTAESQRTPQHFEAIIKTLAEYATELADETERLLGIAG